MAPSKQHRLIKLKNSFLGLFSQTPDNGLIMESTITCPYCGFKQKEKMPLDICVTDYICLNCKKVMHVKHEKEGDCCVFCSYGDTKCPPKQIEKQQGK